MNTLSVIAMFTKEMVDACKDRRGSLSALMYALLGPIVLMVVLAAVLRSAADHKPVRIGVSGGEVAALLATQLESASIEVVTLPTAAAIDAALHEGRIDVALQLPEDAPQRLVELRPLGVGLRVDLGRSDAPSKVATVRRRLDSIASQISDGRLIARGVDPSLANPIRIDVADVGSGSPKLRPVLAVLALFLLLGPFFSSMNAAIDMTAGEREREGLEPLLAQPIAPMAIVLGKYAVALLFGLLGTVLTSMLVWAVLQRLPLYDLPARVALDAGTWFQVVIVMLPLAGLAVAAQMALAWYAKNYKEAQIYLTLLGFAPAFLALPYAMRDGGVPEFAVPLIAEMRMINVLLHGQSLPLVLYVTTVAIELAAIVALLWLAARRLRDERLLCVA